MDQYERFRVGVDRLADLFAGYRQVLLQLQEEALGEMGLNRKLHEMRTIIENCKPLQGDFNLVPREIAEDIQRAGELHELIGKMTECVLGASFYLQKNLSAALLESGFGQIEEAMGKELEDQEDCADQLDTLRKYTQMLPS